MIIKNVDPSTSIPYLWLPVFLYPEPTIMSQTIVVIELILYIICFYIVVVSLKIFVQVRMFHLNFIILAAPIFGIWCELIIGKLITMAYQLKIFSVRFEINQFYVLWTDDPDKMLIVDSFKGLELLIIAGFMEYHYMFSVVFGAVAVAIERICASVLIDNYESTNKIFITILLTIVLQILAILVSCLALFHKLDIITINATWIVSCIFSSIMFLLVERINEKWRAEMENPHWKRVYTISQRFQVKENIRALDLGKRLIFSEIGTISIIGLVIAALLLELVPPSLCHIAENALFLNPFGICTVAMFSIPAWKKRYKNSFPACCRLRSRNARVDVASMEPMEEFNKRISIETDMYFNQLNESWI
ncbi:CRE-SRE-27 protein [Caenorhabditis remanei]|uniref:CRE-SRE-27 protein n=1 Tax=Caenorhabditis remanei TaxID=31234 RepID=E3M144_CAERE|nr:CRE-SRE-27 protein [Caenorhabditis remanei]